MKRLAFALLLAAGAASAQPQPADRPVPQPMDMPKPGPVGKGPYQPQALLPGGIVMPLFPDRFAIPERQAGA